MLSHSEPVVLLREGESSAQTGRGQWIAPASANKVQRPGPAQRKQLNTL